MVTFIEKVWVEYPIPFSVSIWGQVAIENLDTLVETVLEEVSSDCNKTETTVCLRDVNSMPVGCREVISVKLDLGFQGNRYVKKNYDRETNMLYLRMYPSRVKYRRNLVLTDLDTLRGDQLIYVKNYVFMKMATKELTILGSVKYEADNGQMDLENLKAFRDAAVLKVNELKSELSMYGNSR